jgi:NTE family protein
LRHIISQLAALLPEDIRDSLQCKELASWGCRTTMHVVRLLAPTLDSEDYLKDIDFTPSGIRARWQAGMADTRRMIERAPWQMEVDPMEGVIVHELSARTGMEVKEMA